MGLGDTLGNKAEEAKGKIKEEWGDATDKHAPGGRGQGRAGQGQGGPSR
jgi:uncharacterized protein YjbJ (UPF0337 family)